MTQGSSSQECKVDHTHEKSNNVIRPNTLNEKQYIATDGEKKHDKVQQALLIKTPSKS